MNLTFSDRISGVKPSAIREILKLSTDPGIIAFSAGNPSPDAFPVEAIAQITAKVLRENPVGVLQYSLTEGYPPLREALKTWMDTRCHALREFDDLVVVAGAQQGIDLICKTFCNEGDVILCEDPSFIGSLNCFRSYGAKLKGIPMDGDGIDLALLEEALKTTPNVKLLYLIPNFQNPTGITMSLEKRKAVYALAKQYGALILEDNPYGDLRYEGEDVPTLKSMDEDGIVLYCGSFSKVLSPGLRVGYVLAHKDIIPKITVGKQCTDVHTNILAQHICERYMAEYDLPAHIEDLRVLYRKKRDLMLDSLAKYLHPAVTFTHPQGGLFIWCTLPDGGDMMAYAAEAIKRGVAVVPGTAFLADESASSQSFRVNFSTPSEEAIVKGCKILGDLSREWIG